MSKQPPEAMRLANELDRWVDEFSGKAADLLRSQHAEIERLRAELEAISAANSKILEENKELSVAVIESRLELVALRNQEPVAWMHESGDILLPDEIATEQIALNSWKPLIRAEHAAAVEREACIEDARTVGGAFSTEFEALVAIRARSKA